MVTWWAIGVNLGIRVNCGGSDVLDLFPMGKKIYKWINSTGVSLGSDNIHVLCWNIIQEKARLTISLNADRKLLWISFVINFKFPLRAECSHAINWLEVFFSIIVNIAVCCASHPISRKQTLAHASLSVKPSDASVVRVECSGISSDLGKSADAKYSHRHIAAAASPFCRFRGERRSEHLPLPRWLSIHIHKLDCLSFTVLMCV